MTPSEELVRRPVFAVDDEEADRLALARAFSRIDPHGRLAIFENSTELSEALTAAQSGPVATRPAYVLVDLNLPDRNGIELVKDLKHDFPTLPVVMLSGSSREIDQHQASANGADGFVSKPLGLTALTDALRTVDDLWQRFVSPSERTN